MAASNTDKFKKLTNNFSTTLSAPIVGASDTSMSLASTTNLPTDTGIVLVIDRVNSSGTATPSTREYVKGTVSGSNVTNLVRGLGNSTAQAHSTGAVVEQVVDQNTINDLMDGILSQHNQDGTHGAVTTTSINNSGALTQTGASTFTGALTIKSWDGWITDTNTWTYVSATSFKVSGVDVTALFPVGTRLKLTQTTVKYFYVTAASFSTDTTITITGGSDYSLANAAITSPTYSYMVSPQGFPKKFAWSPTVVGWASTTAAQYYFKMTGSQITMYIYVSGTSNSTSTTFTLPVTSSTSLTFFDGQTGLTIDNGSAVGPGRWSIDNSSGTATTIQFFTSQIGGGFINSGTKGLRATVLYEAA